MVINIMQNKLLKETLKTGSSQQQKFIKNKILFKLTMLKFFYMFISCVRYIIQKTIFVYTKALLLLK
jgi:hypothetical protein